MSRWPHGCHNSCAGEPAPTYHGYDCFSTGSSGHRQRITSGTSAAQQHSSIQCVALSGRVVASQCRPARRRRHQHTTSREAALAIYAVVAHSVNDVCTIRGASTPIAAKCTPAGTASRTDGKLHNDGPQGGNQPPPWWGRQPHRHRAPPREVSRYRGSQP
jgi:hypothetical protein